MTSPQADADWRTNTTLEEVAERLRGVDSVVLLTHTKPDGDAVGSTLSVARALRSIGKDAKAAYTGPWQHIFDPIVDDDPSVIHVGPERLDEKLGDPDAVLVVDTGSWSQLSDVAAWLRTRTDRTTVIDHHLHGEGSVGAWRCIHTSAAAASQIVARLCCLLLGVDEPGRLPVEIAEPLYLGIATDTGWFRHSNTTPDALRMAAALLEAGVPHASLYQQIEQSDKPQRLLLKARLLNTLELHCENAAAVLTLRPEDFTETGAGREDTGGLIDEAMNLATVRVAAVITQVDAGMCRISLRSKAPDKTYPRMIDVNEIARSLGGGGHAQAAGARVEADMAQAKALVIQAILDQTR